MNARGWLMYMVPNLRNSMNAMNAKAADVYRYMNFDQIEEYADVAKEVAV